MQGFPSSALTTPCTGLEAQQDSQELLDDSDSEDLRPCVRLASLSAVLSTKERRNLREMICRFGVVQDWRAGRRCRPTSHLDALPRPRAGSGTRNCRPVHFYTLKMILIAAAWAIFANSGSSTTCSRARSGSTTTANSTSTSAGAQSASANARRPRAPRRNELCEHWMRSRGRSLPARQPRRFKGRGEGVVVP